MNTPGLIAKKVGMTRMVDTEGQMIAVTLLQVAPQKVTKLLTQDRDGYSAMQVGYYEKAEKRLNKADIHRLRKASIEDNFCRFKEFRLNGGETYELGAELNLSVLDGVSSVDISGLTKGRGFTGATKRWNAAIGRMSHGSRFHRRPGSLGMRTSPGRVFKNKHQPGQYGHEQITVQNLKVLDIDADNNVIAVKGSVPGHNDGFLVIRPSIKLKK